MLLLLTAWAVTTTICQGVAVRQTSHLPAEKTEAQKRTCLRSGSRAVAEQRVRLNRIQKAWLSVTICPFWEIDLGQPQMTRPRSREVERAQPEVGAPSGKLALGCPCLLALLDPGPSP